jgi:hypothetical protein
MITPSLCDSYSKLLFSIPTNHLEHATHKHQTLGYGLVYHCLHHGFCTFLDVCRLGVMVHVNISDR